jgi:hypothetical protein
MESACIFTFDNNWSVAAAINPADRKLALSVRELETGRELDLAFDGKPPVIPLDKLPTVLAEVQLWDRPIRAFSSARAALLFRLCDSSESS